MVAGGARGNRPRPERNHTEKRAQRAHRGDASTSPRTAACHPWRVFERFTERARQVVVLAQEEARVLRHTYIGTEHLLLGLLREEDGIAARVLGALGITLEPVRAEVARIVGPGEEETRGQIPFTPRAKKVLELALREAQALGHNYIGTEHVLLGLVREDSGVAASILLDLGADAGQVRAEVVACSADPPAASSPQRLAARMPPSGGPIDWRRAQLLWRPEGLELRVPTAARRRHDGPPRRRRDLGGRRRSPALRREIWSGWVALASPTLLDDVDPARAAPRPRRGGRPRARRSRAHSSTSSCARCVRSQATRPRAGSAAAESAHRFAAWARVVDEI